MHKSESKLRQGETVSGGESKVQQNGKFETNCEIVSQSDLDTKEQIIYEDEMFGEVPTADPEEYHDVFLITTHKDPLFIVDPKLEESYKELLWINPRKFLEEVQRTIRERDEANVNPKANQEENGSSNLKTNQIEIPESGLKTVQVESEMEQEKSHSKDTEKHIDMNPFKYHTKDLNLGSKQAKSDPPKKPDVFHLSSKIVNGGFAGVVGVSVVFPLDFVKTRLQTQVPGPDGQLPYKSIFDCFKKTIKSEGYFGMYRGSAVNIILVSPEKAIKLAANDFFRYHLSKPNGELSLFRQTLSGGLAGLFQIIVTTPMELLKIRMQMSGQAISAAKAAGQPIPHVTPFTIVASLLKENGILGLYKGITATMIRDVVFSAIYFPLFATLNAEGPKSSDGSGDTVFWWSFGSGLISGAISALSVTPADVVKTRLQNAKKVQGAAPEYLGVADCFAKTLKNEGVKALFKGGACRIMVIGPVFGITQAVYYLGFAENVFGLKR